MGLKEDLNLIKEEEIKQNTLYLEIGEYYYNNCRGQAEGELKALCDEVSVSQAQVEAYLSAGEDSEEGYFCVQCDGEVPEGSAFCNHCGVRLLIEEVVEVEKPVEEPAIGETEEPAKAAEKEAVEELSEENAEELTEELVEEPAKEAIPTSSSKQCSNCKNPLSDEDIFCTECGTKAPEVASPPPPASELKKFCEHCGNKLIPGNAFCTGCGKPV